MDRRTALRLFGATTVAATATDLEGLARALHRRLGRGAPLQVLDPHQNATVVALCDVILPATDTPGAKAALVNEFIDLVLAEWYEPEERDRLLAGLADVDTQARAAFGKDFVDGTQAEQTALLTALDDAAARWKASPPPRPPAVRSRSIVSSSGSRCSAITRPRSAPSRSSITRSSPAATFRARRPTPPARRSDDAQDLRCDRGRLGDDGRLGGEGAHRSGAEHPGARGGSHGDDRRLRRARAPLAGPGSAGWMTGGRGPRPAGAARVLRLRRMVLEVLRQRPRESLHDAARQAVSLDPRATGGRALHHVGPADLPLERSRFRSQPADGVAVDWPIRYADIAPWYDHVERFIGVSGEKGLAAAPRRPVPAPDGDELRRGAGAGRHRAALGRRAGADDRPLRHPHRGSQRPQRLPLLRLLRARLHHPLLFQLDQRHLAGRACSPASSRCARTASCTA